MCRLKRLFRSGMSLLTILSFLSSTVSTAFANPLDGQVVGGQATISGQGTANVIINQSTSRAAIDWRSFSIDHGERTQFIQPDSHSITLNRVTGADPSRILGTMTANGTIILTNPNGVVFGQGSKVDAAGLVATTHDIDAGGFMAGGALRFNQNAQAKAGASIVNEGQITIHDAGVAALVAPHVRNSGLIVADGGTVNLAAGQGFALDLYGDKLVSFGVDDEIQNTITDANGIPIKALVEHDGAIQASGGKILLTANTARQVVNQAINVTGTLAASYASKQGGKIILSSRNKAGAASGVVNVSNAKIEAKGTSGGTVQVLGDVVNVTNSAIDVSGQQGGGVIRVGGGKQGGENLATASTTIIDRDTTLKADAGQTGKGGNIVVWADDTTDYQGSISAKGGTSSGDGGFAEVSGKKLLKFKGKVDLTAAHGKTGDLLLDPQNLTIQNSAGSPAANCVGSTCTPGGDSSVLTVADLENLLLTSNVTVSTGASGAQAGNITVADNITWATGNRLMLDAHGSIIINGLVTIKNTYTGTFGANDIPVLLSLRADATGINNGGSFTNNGTIDFSGSNGAVSIFYDRATYGGSYTGGTQSQKTGWAAPANLSVSNQFTAYQLINTVADLEAIGSGLSGNYALGKNINGGGLAFNSNVPLGTFTGKLDGQYCALSGGANCSITNLTLAAAAASTAAGLFNTIGAAGIVRNLTLGLSVTQNYTGSTTNYVGALAGTNSGTIANVTSTGSVDYTFTNTNAVTSSVGGLVGLNTGTIRNASTTTGTVTATSANGTSANISTFYVGGLAGQQQTGGTITNSASSQNVSYVYKGTSTGVSVAMVGGLVGYNISTTANSITGSSADGDVSADYFSGFNGNINGYIGGLVGQNGANTATSISNVSATGDVSSTLHTLATGSNFETIGGLIGRNYSSLTTSVSPSISTAFATGKVTYNGTTSASTNVGGLIGYNEGGWVNNTYATGNVSYTGASISSVVAGLISQQNNAGISNSHATGNVESFYIGSTAATSYTGGLVGYLAGAISDSYTENGAVTATSQVSGTNIVHTSHVGGLVAYLAGGSTLTNVKSTQNVSYVYKGTSTGTSVLNIGGLIGNRFVAGTLSGTSFATGNIKAENFTGYNGNVTVNAGGLIGLNGNGNAAITNDAYATGNVTDTLNGSTHYIGGLIGYNNTTGATSNGTASGDVSYNGAGNGAVGGFVGYDSNSSGSITNSTSSGSVANTSGPTAAATSYLGGFAGLMTGTLTNSYSMNTDDVIATSTATGTGIHTFYVGGQVGALLKGTIANVTSSAKVSYVYKGTSTGVHVLTMGGLVGLNTSTTANSISASSSSGNVSADYFTGYDGTITTNIGGLIGQNGNGTATSITNVSATGDVTNKLRTVASGASYQLTAGLIGWNYSTLTTSASPSVSYAFATGKVTYEGNSTASGASTNVAGLVGYNQTGWLDHVYATGNISFIGSTPYANIGGLTSSSYSGISNSYAKGNIDVTYTGSVATTLRVGGLVGYMEGAVSDSYTQDGKITVTSQVSGTNIVSTTNIGGLVATLGAGKISNSTSSEEVSYVYKGTSTGTSLAAVGGLLGYNLSTTANSVADSSASGKVSADYFTGYTGNVTGYIGGAIGQNGNTGNIALSISNVSASGEVISKLQGGTEYVGGLIGWHYSNLTTSASPSINGAHATGKVTYSNTASSSTAGIGGLIGYNQGGWVNNADATGQVSYTGVGAAYVGGLTGWNLGGLSNAHATGAVSYTGTGQGAVGGLIGSNTGIVSNAYAKGNVDHIFTGSTAITSYTGGLIGYNANNVTDSYAEDGIVTATSQVSGTGIIHTSYVGGLIGQSAGATLTNLRSTENVSFVYKGTSTGASLLLIGGLIGYNSAISTLSGTTSASGHVKAENFTGYNGAVSVSAGGLIGQNGNNNAAAITGATASGNVTDTLNGGGNHNIGGLIGYNYSSAIITSSSASGDVSYNGVGNGNVGGFVGYDGHASGSITDSTASGSVTNTTGVGVTATSYLGGFAGLMTGTLTNSYSTNTGNIIATSTATGGVHTFYVGGQVGYLSKGTIANVTSGANVSYVYKGASSSTSVAYVGGLVGYNISTTANSISNSSHSGDVTAVYFTGFTGNVSGYIGGAIGVNGANGAISVSGVSATGDVRSTLQGGTEYVGGLIGWNYSNLTTSASPSVSGNSFAMGDVSYIGTSAANVGGLIGYVQTGWIDNVHATGAVSYTGGGQGAVGGLVGASVGGTSNAYAKGNVENIFNGNTAVTSYTGGLIGYASGSITDSYTQDGTVTATSQVSGTNITHTAMVGGLVGMQAGNISNSTSSQNVSFVHKGTTTGLSTVSVGGLVGYNITASTSITGSSASGDVSAEYFTGYTGNVTGYIGGLIGRYGNNNAVSVSNSSATGDVRSTLVGGNEYVGGLIGWSNSSLSTSVSPGLSNVFATGDVSYEGTAGAHVGGLVGNNPYSWIDNAHATGKVSYIGSGNAVVGGLIGQMSAGVSNTYAKGDVEVTYTGSAAYTLNVGGLIGQMSGVLSDSYAEDGDITVTIQNSGTLGGASYVGGLVGQLSNNATNVRSAQNVSYVYKGTSNALSSAYLGGLVGLHITTNTSIANGRASGEVKAGYFTGYTGNVAGYMGGLIGQFGQNTSVGISNSSATGNVRSTLTGGEEYLGGLIGWSYSTRTTSGSPAVSTVFATGHVSYDATSAAAIGGLIGYNQTGWVDKSYATGNVHYSGAGISSLGGLIGNSVGSISNSYAMGMVDYQGTSTASVIGGLVGRLTTGGVERSFATGYVYGGVGVGGGLVAAKNVSATITDSYWDTDTTGQSVSVGGTGLTTTQLQATLQSNFSSSDWAILAGISYPYLKWQLPSGTPQIVTGYTYSDSDETVLKGAEVALAVDGAAVNSALTNGHVYSGANGYYYYFLAPNTISGGGSDLLAYLPGTVKANAIHTGVTGSVNNMNLYGGWLNIASGKATLSGVMSGLAGIAGGSNSADFLFAISGNDLTLASGANLGLYLTNSSTDIDMAMTMATGSTLLIDSDDDVTQSAGGITADELVLTGTGDFALTHTDNAIDKLAAHVGTLELNNGSADLIIGSVGGIDGLTADDIYLTTTGHVTQTEAIATDNLLLSGTGGIYDLDHADNVIGTLAAHTGTVNLNNGSHDLVIGSVNNIDGVTADDVYLLTTGEVTQTEALVADNVSLAGAGSIYDLDHADNAIGALSADVKMLNLNNGSADLIIGSVNNIDGVTAEDVYLTTTGHVTQSEAMTAENLLLSGTGGIYDLDDADNEIDTLAAHTGTVNLNNGSHDLLIGSVNNVDGVTADDLYLATTGHVTQSEAVIADHVSLAGVNSIYDLDHADNAIGMLAADAGTLNINNGSADLVIGAVNDIDGIHATDLYLATTGHVTQTKALVADHVSLTGIGSIYDLTHTGNAIDTLAAHAGSLDVNNGGHDIVVGAVNMIDGITTTAGTRIAHAGHITLNKTITASGTGDTIVLAGTRFTNNVGAQALDAGTGRFLVWSGDPADDDIGSLVGHTQYAATYGVTTPGDPGNSFLYSYNPAGPGPGPVTDPVKIVLASTSGISQLHQMTSVLSATSAATALPAMQSDVTVDADVEASCNSQVVTSSAQSIAITCSGGAQ